MPLAHLFQGRADQLSIGLEEPVRHFGETGRQALFAIFDHSCVPERVLVRNAIGYAIAVDDGLTIES